ncbi:alpha/beta fold hydrolase [Parasphingopyxis marina]|uniref:alpha/beta fold hydrolase n=1 Tax=Parasphingopyxis marina TaxID=2761622 RepID=UPI001F1FDA58|nr:alpha/beta fold hydrolase [Parasphingopyxis marina]
MAKSPIDPEPHYYESRDGQRLAWREMGEGRPIVLLHGFFSNAFTNWIRYGHAEKVAAKGYRVIMPDHRAHGDSAKPHDPAAYPPDILAQDGLALIEHLGLEDYDLGGYSLGARTVVRMHVLGARPGRLVVSGMGLAGLVNLGKRANHFRHILENLGKHEQGSPEWMAEAFLKTTKGDPEALLLVLNVFTDTPVEALEAIVMPTLILVGDEDRDNGDPDELAAVIPHAEHVAVPGGHMSCIVKPEFGDALADWLGDA